MACMFVACGSDDNSKDINVTDTPSVTAEPVQKGENNGENPASTQASELENKENDGDDVSVIDKDSEAKETEASDDSNDNKADDQLTATPVPVDLEGQDTSNNLENNQSGSTTDPSEIDISGNGIAGNDINGTDNGGGDTDINENIVSPIIGMVKYYANEPLVPVSKEMLKGRWKVTSASMKMVMEKYISTLDASGIEFYDENMYENAIEFAQEMIWEYLSDSVKVRLCFYEDKAAYVEHGYGEEGVYVGTDVDNEGTTSVYFGQSDANLYLLYYPENEMLVVYNEDYEIVCGLVKQSDNPDNVYRTENGEEFEIPKNYGTLSSFEGLQGVWKLDGNYIYESFKEEYIMDNGPDFSEEEFLEEFEDFFGEYDTFMKEAEMLTLEIDTETLKVIENFEGEDAELIEMYIDTSKDVPSLVGVDGSSGFEAMLFYNAAEDALLLIEDPDDDIQFKFIRK